MQNHNEAIANYYHILRFIAVKYSDVKIIQEGRVATPINSPEDNTLTSRWLKGGDIL